jgi:hypothetical protein
LLRNSMGRKAHRDSARLGLHAGSHFRDGVDAVISQRKGVAVVPVGFVRDFEYDLVGGELAGPVIGGGLRPFAKAIGIALGDSANDMPSGLRIDVVVVNELHVDNSAGNRLGRNAVHKMPDRDVEAIGGAAREPVPTIGFVGTERGASAQSDRQSRKKASVQVFRLNPHERTAGLSIVDAEQWDVHLSMGSVSIAPVH